MPTSPYPELNNSVNPYSTSTAKYPDSGSRYYKDTEATASDLIGIIENAICTWIPDIPSWGIDYGLEGPTQVTQSWIVPNSPQVALAARQMLSWNRDQFGAATAFYDRYAALGRKRAPKNLVPVNVKLLPLATNNGGYIVDNHWTSRSVKNAGVVCTEGGQPNNCAFPTVVTEKWRMDITWGLDEFRNRYNVQYAKVEIEPSIRLESIQGNNMGVVPLTNGEPDLTVTPESKKINTVSTGFPAREPQLLIKITYPWVRLDDNYPSIMSAGPIAKWDSNNAPAVGVMPDGCYLGCVNSKTFMGFPKGRVLYQSADMVEKVSPVTGRLGYQITHVFLVLPTASWNMTRYVGNIDDAGGLAADSIWPYGYMVALKKDRTIKTVGGSGVYPYLHKDLNDLLYYNNPLTGTPVVPTDEG